MVDALFLTDEIMNQKAFENFKGDPINHSKNGN